jgi:hypothetical protein
VTLYDDLESMASAIKHGLPVDLDDVRVLCRRAQDACEVLTVLRGAESLCVRHDDDGAHVVIVAAVDDAVEFLRVVYDL